MAELEVRRMGLCALTADSPPGYLTWKNGHVFFKDRGDGEPRVEVFLEELRRSLEDGDYRAGVVKEGAVWVGMAYMKPNRLYWSVSHELSSTSVREALVEWGRQVEKTLKLVLGLLERGMAPKDPERLRRFISKKGSKKVIQKLVQEYKGEDLEALTQRVKGEFTSAGIRWSDRHVEMVRDAHDP